jgi:hypothetical protein
MRKKLLALLMCATMVLGSSAVASAATITPDDISNAQKVIDQYTDGAIDKEVDAKSTKVTFSVKYENGSDTAFYNYGIVDTKTDNKATTTVVKTDKSGNALTQVNAEAIIGGIDDVNHVVYFKEAGAVGYTTAGANNGATNPSASTVNISSTAASIVSGTSNYYVQGSWALAGTALASDQYAVVTEAQFTAIGDSDYPVSIFDTDSNLTASRAVVTLTKYTKSETAISTTATAGTTDTFGVDPDGYIALKDSKTSVVELSKEIADGYWVSISQATASLGDVAQALADSEISASAVAVQIDFYELTANTDLDKNTTDNPNGEESFMQLKKVKTAKSNVDVTFKSDWLSRSNAKNANKVYVINPNYGSDKIAEYFFKIGSVYEVSDLADNAFTTNYIVSGTYIFDTVEDASQNDGVNDEATTTATTAAPAADTAATSPKTGDVAPIAALAVVMMGACGAMVVASKKRA